MGYGAPGESPGSNTPASCCCFMISFSASSCARLIRRNGSACASLLDFSLLRWYASIWTPDLEHNGRGRSAAPPQLPYLIKMTYLLYLLLHLPKINLSPANSNHLLVACLAPVCMVRANQGPPSENILSVPLISLIPFTALQTCNLQLYLLVGCEGS